MPQWSVPPLPAHSDRQLRVRPDDLHAAMRFRGAGAAAAVRAHVPDRAHLPPCSRRGAAPVPFWAMPGMHLVVRVPAAMRSRTFLRRCVLPRPQAAACAAIHSPTAPERCELSSHYRPTLSLDGNLGILTDFYCGLVKWKGWCIGYIMFARYCKAEKPSLGWSYKRIVQKIGE